MLSLPFYLSSHNDPASDIVVVGRNNPRTGGGGGGGKMTKVCPMCFVRLDEQGHCECCGNTWGEEVLGNGLLIIKQYGDAYKAEGEEGEGD